MENIFETIYSNGITGGNLLISAGCALVGGLFLSWITSFRLRTTRGLFVTVAALPCAVSIIFSLIEIYLSGAATTTARLIAAAVAFGLIRFRSAQGKAEELLLLFIATASGFAFGMGYITFGFIGSIGLALIYVGLTFLPIFDHKYISSEKLLKIVIPESLNYSEVFEETFSHYLKVSELIEVKTTNMGSLFRISYRVRLKNQAEEKEFIDEIRTKNGNLEISLLPYVDNRSTL